MRTLTYTAFVSLDGVVDSPGGGPTDPHRSAGWTFNDIEFLPEAYDIKGREQQEATAMMMGRASYDVFSPVWPGMKEFADYKVMPKYVVSTTVTSEDLVHNWGETTILRSLDDVAKLKETDGGPIIIHGSAMLAQPVRRPPARPLPPACVPGAARGRQADVHRHRQGQADADPGRERVVPQRHPEAGVRRRPVTLFYLAVMCDLQPQDAVGGCQ